MAWRNMRTSWRSSVAVIRSTEGEIPTAAHQQMLREAGKSLRESCKDDRIIRPKGRAGQAMNGREDGPFMTDVAATHHGALRQ
jgi:hypothetical protein